MFDFVRIACAVNDLKVGDTAYNTQDIIKKIKTAKENKADIVVFPELSITGYTCGDLFFQDALLKNAEDSLEKILEYTENIIVVVGVPLKIRGKLYNCGVVLENGKIKGIVPKQNAESRWFGQGISLEYELPFGTDLVFSVGEYKFALEIGDDLLSPIAPSTSLAMAGAEIILNLSAAGEIAGRTDFRRNVINAQSGRLICTYVSVSAGYNESTSDTVYNGKSIVSENGKIIKENENYIDNDYVMIFDTDLGKIKADRMKNAHFVSSASVREIQMEKKESESQGEYYPISKLPFIPENNEDRIKRCVEIFSLQVAGLKKRIEVTGSRPVLGISGGLDSTLALLVCVRAVRQLGKSTSEVVAVTMPGFGTTDRTYTNALEMMENLGVTVKEISIKEACELHFKDIGHDIAIHDVTYENAQARERTQILMDIANKEGGFVVGTGDLSELMLGWCTYSGDQMSMYGVNSGVPKSLIRHIIDSVIEKRYFDSCEGILRDILDTPISPELLPPDENGKIAQKTEDLVGPYVLHDFFIYYAVRYGFTPEKILHLACRAFRDDFDRDTISKWEKVFYRRFFSQQFKRSCMPDGVKVGTVGVSPKGDLIMPSDAVARLWLENI